MITKTGDFREGESRSDFDMTKIARVQEDLFVAADKSELEKNKPNINNATGPIRKL